MLSGGSLSTPSYAQDADALRRELDTLRRQLSTMTQAYEERLKALSERVEQLEAPGTPPPIATAPPPRPPAPGARGPGATPAPPPVAPAPAPVAAPVAVAAVASAAPGSEGPSVREMLTPRQPFALSPPGRVLLFDIGVSGDFVADLTSARTERLQQGTFPGQENRFFPREVELALFGRVDPYASAVVRISAGEQSSTNAPSSRDLDVNLDEANVTLLTLPLGTTARFGLMRPRFGTLNTIHQDDLPQVDRPDVLTQFFGPEEMDGESGLEAFWVLPLPNYNELSLGIFNGDNEVAFGRGSLREPLVMGRWRTFFEFEEHGGLQLDVSAASGLTSDNQRNTIVGLGAKYKWIGRSGSGFPVFTLAGEALAGFRDVSAADAGPGGDRHLEPLGRLSLRAVRPRPRGGRPACAGTGPSCPPLPGASGPCRPTCSSSRRSSSASACSTSTPRAPARSTARSTRCSCRGASFSARIPASASDAPARNVRGPRSRAPSARRARRPGRRPRRHRRRRRSGCGCCATLPDLWSITRALVGDLGDVQVATRPGQNPHDLEIRPSQISLVKRAEILVRNGLDEDAWIDPVIESSGNPRLLRGSPSVVEAVRGSAILKVRTGPVDRSLGDVHPAGNPHFTLDPGTAPVVTANIVAGLGRLAARPGRAPRGQPCVRFLDEVAAATRTVDADAGAVPGGGGGQLSRQLAVLLPRLRSGGASASSRTGPACRPHLSIWPPSSDRCASGG